jgi:hypothetical protein
MYYNVDNGIELKVFLSGDSSSFSSREVVFKFVYETGVQQRPVII